MFLPGNIPRTEEPGRLLSNTTEFTKESDTTEWLTLSLHTKKQINKIGGPAVGQKLKCWPGRGHHCNIHSLTHEPCQSLHFKKIFYFRIRVGIRMESWCYLPPLPFFFLVIVVVNKFSQLYFLVIEVKKHLQLNCGWTFGNWNRSPVNWLISECNPNRIATCHVSRFSSGRY